MAASDAETWVEFCVRIGSEYGVDDVRLAAVRPADQTDHPGAAGAHRVNPRSCRRRGVGRVVLTRARFVGKA